jgi:hypothetical protein
MELALSSPSVFTVIKIESINPWNVVKPRIYAKLNVSLAAIGINAGVVYIQAKTPWQPNNLRLIINGGIIKYPRPKLVLVIILTLLSKRVL